MDPEDYNKKQLSKGLLTWRHITRLVESFQERNALTVDGKAGPNTLKTIKLPGVFDGFVWPVPWQRESGPPVITSKFGEPRDGGRRKHMGVDIMYRNKSPTPREHRSESRTKWFHMPQDTYAMAVYDGIVYKRKFSERWGHSVTIDHGNISGFGRCMTFYQHLNGWDVLEKQEVNRGQILGDCGAGKTGVVHLHFGLYRKSAWGLKAVDPGLYMSGWEVIS